jgi:hypothetical protein
MKSILCLLAVALATQTISVGREVTLRLLAFDTATIPAESFVFDPAAAQPEPGVEAPIKGYLNHEGVTLQLGGNDLVFSKSSKVEDANDASLQLAKVTLPKTGRNFMLIFLPAGNERFRVLAVDDSVSEFPLGSYRVINLSRVPVRLSLEKKIFEFKSGQSQLITEPPVQANNHSAMYAFAEIDGKWQRIGSGLWPHPGLKRSVQIFFDNPDSAQTELRGFRDIAPPKPAPPKTSSP